LGLRALGGWDVLMEQAGDKFHTVMPLDHPELPWFAIFFGGLWVANLFYWGCNQFITQRTLGARSLAQGRYGVVFAAYIKLTIPFIIVIPGIVASVLYAGDLERSDMAYPMLLERLLPAGLTGLMFAALMAAIMSSLDSMLNSSATIFTIDIYQRRLRPNASQKQLIAVGRWSTVAFLLMAAGWAPFLTRFERVFSYIQEFWGLITPGVAVVFLAGLFWRRATASAAALGMAVTLPVTIVVKLLMPGFAFLDQMWVAALVIGAIVIAVSLWRPEARQVDEAGEGSGPSPEQPEGARIETGSRFSGGERDPLFDALCIGVVVLTVALYIIFF
jgi:SSS family solute:Na+ symporter